MKHFKAPNRIFDEFQAKLVSIWLSAIIKIAKLFQCNVTKPPVIVEYDIHEAYWLTDSVGLDTNCELISVECFNHNT